MIRCDDAHLMVRPSFDNDITEKLGCVLTWSESRKFVGLHPAILAVGRLAAAVAVITHSSLIPQRTTIKIQDEVHRPPPRRRRHLRPSFQLP